MAMRAMSHPKYKYNPWPDDRRERHSALAKRRLGAPDGHATVYGCHVKNECADEIRAAAVKVAGKSGYIAAHNFVKDRIRGIVIPSQKKWSSHEDHALLRRIFDNKTFAQTAKEIGRSRNEIAGRLNRLGIKSGSGKHGYVPLKTRWSLVETHFDGFPRRGEVMQCAMVCIAPMFFSGKVSPLALTVFTQVSRHIVERSIQTLSAVGIFDENGLVDPERYIRQEGGHGIQLSDLMLTTDAMACAGLLRYDNEQRIFLTEKGRKARRG